MERSKALIASALVATGLTIGAGIYVAGSGLLAGASDNVGNLQPATTTTAPAAPREITVYVDPATGAATTVPPQSAPVGARAPATLDDSSTPTAAGDQGGERHDDHGGEERGEDDD